MNILICYTDEILILQQAICNVYFAGKPLTQFKLLEHQCYGNQVKPVIWESDQIKLWESGQINVMGIRSNQCYGNQAGVDITVTSNHIHKSDDVIALMKLS